MYNGIQTKYSHKGEANLPYWVVTADLALKLEATVTVNMKPILMFSKFSSLQLALH